MRERLGDSITLDDLADYLDEPLSAKPLTAEQFAEIEAIAPRGAIAGSRYPASHMASLDSEKR